MKINAGCGGPQRELGDEFVMMNSPMEPGRSEWIPCKDRLPEEGVDVLISYRYKEGEGDTSHMYIDISSYGTVSFGGHKLEGIKEWGQPFAYFNSNYEVVAWMPLPEPYKEEE